MRDCCFLLADKDMRFALKGLLERPEVNRSIRCAPFEFDVAADCLVAGNHDPDVFRKSAGYARPLQRSHRHLVVMLDSQWGGSPGAGAIEERIRTDLSRSGWVEDRFAVIVIEPELEAWLWQEGPIVDEVLGFSAGRFGSTSLRDWLIERELWLPGEAKPRQPKKAFTDTLARALRPRSSTIFEKIASRVSLRHCSDPAFHTLCESLRRWFPA